MRQRNSNIQSRNTNRAHFTTPRVYRNQKRVVPEEPIETKELVPELDTFFSDLTGARSTWQTRSNAKKEYEDKFSTNVRSLHMRTELPGEKVANTFSHNASAQQTQTSVMWIELGLCKALVRAVSHCGFLAPTPVQVAAIPAILSGQDVYVRAVTGSGKTAAFLLPLAHHLLTHQPMKRMQLRSKRKYVRGLIVVPTRELGVQCESMLRSLLTFTSGLTLALVMGGIHAAAQEAQLQASPDILIATPGRLVDFLHNSSHLDLSGVEMVVLDECDKMMTITLKDQIVDIIQHIPVETRQVLMFSATMTDEVNSFAEEHLFKPRNIDIGHVALQSRLRQHFVRIKLDSNNNNDNTEKDNNNGSNEEKQINAKNEEENKVVNTLANEQEHISKTKTRYLVALCSNYVTGKAIIFCRYRTTVHRLQLLFNALQLPALEIQGNQPQEERLRALNEFAHGTTPYLITTDIAARGLDFENVENVINFDLPSTLTAYIHRVGRTARIGHDGVAISLVDETNDVEVMRKILTVSGAINGHQVASVKRRDIPTEQLDRATKAIDEVFSTVRAQLAAEELEARVQAAEKRYGHSAQYIHYNNNNSNDNINNNISNNNVGQNPFVQSITAKPQKEWCLSKAERKQREAMAREQQEQEAEITLNHFQNALSSLAKEENAILQQQRQRRRVAREQKERVAMKEKEKRKELRQKANKKLQAGVVKKLKRKKLREARREQRMGVKLSKARSDGLQMGNNSSSNGGAESARRTSRHSTRRKSGKVLRRHHRKVKKH